VGTWYASRHCDRFIVYTYCIPYSTVHSVEGGRTVADTSLSSLSLRWCNGAGRLVRATAPPPLPVCTHAHALVDPIRGLSHTTCTPTRHARRVHAPAPCTEVLVCERARGVRLTQNAPF